MANKIEKRNEAFGLWFAKSKLGLILVPKLIANPSLFVIIIQWVLVGLYFPLACITQWIPLLFIIYMSWWSGTFYAWREVIKMTVAKDPFFSLGVLISTVATELIKYIFLFAALFDIFGTIQNNDHEIIEGVWSHVYFSTVTITTLGYGNLVPVGMLSEVLAAIEAFVGFMIFAIIAGFSATIIIDKIRQDM